jgi:hypothetical protein
MHAHTHTHKQSNSVAANNHIVPLQRINAAHADRLGFNHSFIYTQRAQYLIEYAELVRDFQRNFRIIRQQIARTFI